MPTLGAGIPQRFASASHLYTPGHQQSDSEVPSGGTSTSKLSSLMSKMNLDSCPVPNGSPYDTYSKPKGFGNAKRSLSGLGFGPKQSFGMKSSSNLATHTSKLNFAHKPIVTNNPVLGNMEASDTESMDLYNGQSGDSSGSGSETVSRISGGHQQFQQHQSPMHNNDSSDVESIVTTFTGDWSNLDKRVKEALTLPDLNTLRIERIRKRNSLTPKHSPHSGSHSNRSSFGSGSISSTNSSSTTNNDNYNSAMDQKFARLFGDLSNQDIKVVYIALDHLNNALKEYHTYSPYLEPRIDQLIVLANKQFRLFMTKHYPESDKNEDSRRQAELLFRAVGSVLMKVFQHEVGKHISRDTLRELITHLLPYFHELRENKNIFTTVNMLITELIKGADTTNLLSALIRMLHDYVGSVAGAGGEAISLSSLKSNGTASGGVHLETYLGLTMKFIWRLVKFFDEHSSQLNVDVILYESHHFFKSYPRKYY